jgi:hypothetical protein
VHDAGEGCLRNSRGAAVIRQQGSGQPVTNKIVKIMMTELAAEDRPR